MIKWPFVSILFLYQMTHIDFLNVNQPCIPKMNLCLFIQDFIDQSSKGSCVFVRALGCDLFLHVLIRSGVTAVLVA